MKLSVMLFPFHAALLERSLTPKDLLRQLADHGAVAVETMHSLFNADPILFQQLLDEIRAAGMSVVCHDIEANLIAPEEKREEIIRQATRKIDFARKIVGTSMVLLYGSDNTLNLPLHKARAVYAETLGEIAAFADILGVTTTIEDFGMVPELACRAQDCRDVLLTAQPLPAMTFDTGNFFYAGQTAREAYPILRDFIRHVHIKDLTLSPEGNVQPATVGNGIVEIRELCRLLKRDGYRETLSIEIYGNDLEDALKALDFLKTCDI